MKKKTPFLAGAAVGYVLGARAGRARYEQIRRVATTFWQSAPVGDARQHLNETLAEEIPKMRDAATGAVGSATGAVVSGVHKVRSTVTHDHRTPTGAGASTGYPTGL